MARCFYRLSETSDPEERLEDAALAKALHDVMGEDLQILSPQEPWPDHGLHLGRTRMFEGPPRNLMAPAMIRYWEDPAFRAHTAREWSLLDLPAAKTKVKELHASGRDAFVKSTLGTKHYRERIPQGIELSEALDAMVYSFIDRDPCLLVQEAVEMTCERRFLIIDREVLTHSTVANSLTPLSRFQTGGGTLEFDDLHAKTPGVNTLQYNPTLTQRMLSLAQEIADQSEFESLCLDMCLIDSGPLAGRLEIIEYNPMQPGMVGLFGCNPYALAEGVKSWLDDRPYVFPPKDDLDLSSTDNEPAAEGSGDWMTLDV